jgi:hypothetical protein
LFSVTKEYFPGFPPKELEIDLKMGVLENIVELKETKFGILTWLPNPFPT